MVTKVAKKPLNGLRTSWNRMDCVSAFAHPRRIDGARIGTNAGSVWDERASHPCSRPSLKLFRREILRATTGSLPNPTPPPPLQLSSLVITTSPGVVIIDGKGMFAFETVIQHIAILIR